MADRAETPLARRRPDLAVAPGDLRLTVEAERFAFETTAEVTPPVALVGQERAVEALELGLVLRDPASNVFVAGPSGSGRMTATRGLVDRLAAGAPRPPDRAYVRRFADPVRPQLLTFPAGTAAPFARALEELRRNLARRIPLLLDDRELGRRREALGRRYAEEDETAIAALRRRAEADGFALVSVEMGPFSHPEIVPVRNGQPTSLEQLERVLAPATLTRTREQLETYNQELRDAARASRERQRAFAAELRTLVGEAAKALATEELAEARSLVRGDDARGFLDAVAEDIEAAVVDIAEAGADALARLGAHLERYRVNVVADRAGTSGAPVVVERFPTRQNLAGSVERVQDGPMSFRADHTTIRAGALLRADGGFLVLHALDLLQEPGAFDAVKRTLATRQLEIGASAAGALFGLPRLAEPDPIPVDVKVVLVGERSLHDLLWRVDPDFRKLFGIRADFAGDMPFGDAALERYACVVAGLARDEGLPHATAAAVGALVEDGIRRAGRRNRVSARFSEAAALLRQSAVLARGRGADVVERSDVDEATARRQRREGLVEERMEDLLEEGVVLVSTAGTAVGRVNGLSVYDLGYHAFGKPTRITASAAPGQAGIINVEREARLSGSVYDKGVLIISGYLRRRYADTGPLTLTASLAFEQSYAGVDGDSASIAEVVALLSELSGLPADGALAITGSISQHGDVQPVGGVNEKLEGFWRLCAAGGLTGAQGVVLPRQNVLDLMLARELCADVAAGRFAIRAVERVEDALEIALDAPIAEIDRRVRERLAAFAEQLRTAPAADQPPTSAAVAPPQAPVPGQHPR
jgi:predicted ATP-dependent protease